jgi:hydrogenase maturation protease
VIAEGQPRIRVLGLGNVLMGDDGFGPSVAHALERGWEQPDDVEVIDVGTPGLNLTPFLSGPERIILLDVAEHDGPVGEVRLFSREDVLRMPVPQRVSPHDPGLREALLALDFAGQGPRDFRLVAARPQHVGTGPGLSPCLQAAVPAAIEAVLALLAQWNASPRRRTQPAGDGPWWSAGTTTS